MQAVAASVPQAVAATQAQRATAQQAPAAPQAQQAEAPAEANAAARGAHAPKAPVAESPTPDRNVAGGDGNRQVSAPARLFVPEVYDTAPISWTAGGTVGIARPEPEAPESGDEGEDGKG